MTFGSSETAQKTTNVPSFASPVSHTWYKWDEDFSESDTEFDATATETKMEVVCAAVAEEKTSAFAPMKAVMSPVAGIVGGAVSYLSYTRRWYTSLSCVGAAM